MTPFIMTPFSIADRQEKKIEGKRCHHAIEALLWCQGDRCTGEVRVAMKYPCIWALLCRCICIISYVSRLHCDDPPQGGVGVDPFNNNSEPIGQESKERSSSDPMPSGTGSALRLRSLKLLWGAKLIETAVWANHWDIILPVERYMHATH